MDTDKDFFKLTEDVWYDLHQNFMKYDTKMSTLGSVIYKTIITLSLHDHDAIENFEVYRIHILRDTIMSEYAKICMFHLFCDSKNRFTCKNLFNCLLGNLYIYLFPKYKYYSLVYISDYLNKIIHLDNYIAYMVYYGEFKCNTYYTDYIEVADIPINKSKFIDEYDVINKLKLSDYFPFQFDNQLFNFIFNPQKKQKYINRYYGRMSYKYYEFLGDAIVDCVIISILIDINKFTFDTYQNYVSNRYFNEFMYSYQLCNDLNKFCANKFESIIGVIYLHCSLWSQLEYFDNWLRHIYI